MSSCSFGNFICSKNAVCKQFTNTFGISTIACECKEGYEGTGYRIDGECKDINECIDENICKIENSECLNTDGSYDCVCKPNYVYHPINNSTGYCLDIDECEADLDFCNKKISTCINTKGSYQCICKDPSKHFYNHRCIDYDPCIFDNNCPKNSICTYDKSNEQAYCVCDPGFEYVTSLNKCENIDECLNNPCPKNISTCIDLFGSYRCVCNTEIGYKNDPMNPLNGCININECLEIPKVCGSLPCCMDLKPQSSMKFNKGYICSDYVNSRLLENYDLQNENYDKIQNFTDLLPIDIIINTLAIPKINPFSSLGLLSFISTFSPSYENSTDSNRILQNFDLRCPTNFIDISDR